MKTNTTANTKNTKLISYRLVNSAQNKSNSLLYKSSLISINGSWSFLTTVGAVADVVLISIHKLPLKV